MHYFSHLFSSRGRQQRPWITKNVWFHSEAALCWVCCFYSLSQKTPCFGGSGAESSEITLRLLPQTPKYPPKVGDISNWLSFWGCGPSLKKEGHQDVMKELFS